MDKSNCKKFLASPNINPLTNRKIKSDGPTYKKLSKECEKYAGTPPKTRKPLKKKKVSPVKESPSPRKKPSSPPKPKRSPSPRKKPSSPPKPKRSPSPRKKPASPPKPKRSPSPQKKRVSPVIPRKKPASPPKPKRSPSPRRLEQLNNSLEEIYPQAVQFIDDIKNENIKREMISLIPPYAFGQKTLIEPNISDGTIMMFVKHLSLIEPVLFMNTSIVQFGSNIKLFRELKAIAPSSKIVYHNKKEFWGNPTKGEIYIGLFVQEKPYLCGIYLKWAIRYISLWKGVKFISFLVHSSFDIKDLEEILKLNFAGKQEFSIETKNIGRFIALSIRIHGGLSCFLDGNPQIYPYVPEPVKMLEYNPRLWRARFPIVSLPKNASMSNLKLTNVGEYSIAKPEISAILVSTIKQVARHIDVPLNSLKIVETNAGLGGFTISLAQICKKIYAIEAHPIHAEILTQNCAVYDIPRDKLEVINKDYLNVQSEIKADIYVLDPPWGGREALNKEKIMIGMNNIKIWCIIKNIFKDKLAKAVVLYAPKNFDLEELDSGLGMKYRKYEIPTSKKGHYFLEITPN